MSALTNLYIDAGSDFNAIITCTGSDGKAINLYGWTIKAQMKKSYASATVYNFTTSVYSVPAGKVKLSLPSSVSKNIKPGRYLYDIVLTSLTGEKLRITEGIVIITPAITTF